MNSYINDSFPNWYSGQQVLAMSEAVKIAKKRNQKLVQHRDIHLESKGKRNIFKLVANKEMFEGNTKRDTKKSSFIKVNKNLFSLIIF